MQFVPNLPQLHQSWNQFGIWRSPVPELTISPIISSIKPTTVVHYLKQFGALSKVDLQRGRFCDVIIVRFEDINSANAMLRKRYHRIGNFILAVTCDASTIVPHHGFKHVNNFMDLTDKQLLKIFNQLNVYDLCAVANTCIRFQHLAKHCFSASYDEITWRAGNTRAKDVFETFGQLIESLDVDVIEPANEFFDYIATICRNNRLRHLGLWMNDGRSSQLANGTLVKLQRLFFGLHRLDIYCREIFEISTTKQLLSSCYQLETLSLNCTNGINHLDICFPRLQQLIFYFNCAINNNGLEILLRCNPSIKKLYLDECASLTPTVFGVIVRCLPKLDELTLGHLLQRASIPELRELGGLKYLKSLTILLGPAIPLLTVVLESGLLIKNMVLWYVDINDQLIERLCLMKSIKKLEFYGNVRVSDFIMDHHLKLLATNLHDLNELHIICSEHVTMYGLQEMLLYAKKLRHLSLANMHNISIHDKQGLLNFAKFYCRNLNLNIEIAPTETF